MLFNLCSCLFLLDELGLCVTTVKSISWLVLRGNLVTGRLRVIRKQEGTKNPRFRVSRHLGRAL